MLYLFSALFYCFAINDIESQAHSLTGLSQPCASELVLTSATLAFLFYQVFLSFYFHYWLGKEEEKALDRKKEVLDENPSFFHPIIEVGFSKSKIMCTTSFLTNLLLFFALFLIQWFSLYVLVYEVLNSPLSLLYYPLIGAGFCFYVRFFISLLLLISRIPSIRERLKGSLKEGKNKRLLTFLRLYSESKGDISFEHLFNLYLRFSFLQGVFSILCFLTYLLFYLIA